VLSFLTMLRNTGTVVTNRRIGPDAYWMEVEAPDLAALALPGQFAMLRCAEGLDPLTSRPLSIADAVGDLVTFAYVVVGRGTGLLSEMKPGHKLPILGPLGKPFHFLEPAPGHIMIAGGIGSAPFPFLARALREEAPDAERVVLLGGRSEQHLFGLELFRELATTVETATDDGSHGHHGLVTDLLEPWLENPGNRLYACGPTPMFKSIDQVLQGHTNPCEISVEPIMACGFGACYGCVVPKRDGDEFVYVKSCETGPTFEIRDLRIDLMGSHE
jgi:dihydroorotate dehydrogenase electron transfer subunit